MAQLDRRGHHHFRILFIDLFDLWNRMFIDPERSRQRGEKRFSDRRRRRPASLAAALLGGILACGGGGSAADKGGPSLAAPLITSQPLSQTVTAGANVSFAVAASGNPAPIFTWERSNDSGGTWAAISAANAATYTFTAAKADHQARFRARAANTVNTAISDAATLSVQWLDITAQPAGQAVTAPAAATFAITVDASPAAIFQWQASADGTRWSDLSGATGTSYITGATTLSDSGKQFRCVATNAARELASDPATLTVNAPLVAPAFTVQPANQTVTAGSDATFTVAATGNPSPTFAWERSNDGGGTWAVISGATSATYAFTAQLADHSAQFRAKATNSVDTAVSEAATLSIGSVSIPIPDIINPGNFVALDLVAIPSGSFIMGSPDAETDRYPDEGPQHQVTISRAFYMAKFECTRAQWLAVMGTDPSQAAGGLQFPVDSVHYNAISWPVAGFMDKLNAATQGVRPAGLTFRLPTEAEWEYACRAGSNTPFYFGDDYPISTLHSYAWYSNNSGGTTHPVGQKNPNIWGLYDMLGNVSEWCQDWYGDYSADPQTDPLGPTTGSVRTIRGGSFEDVRSVCRSSCRNYASPSFGDARMGFRVVLAPTQPNPGTPLRFTLPGNLALDMLPVPAGTFTMGSSDSELDRGSDESPQHLVSLDAFYMAKLECTQAQWLAVMGGTNPSFFSIVGTGSTTDDLTRPVEQVSYGDITGPTSGFLARLNAVSTTTRPAGLVFRLPTEAEWEYAARAGTTTRFYWGEDPLCTAVNEYAWWDVNSDGKTHPVGTKPQNPWGLFDMIGNVWEWCQDWYGAYSGSSQTNPAGPVDGSLRINRGGGWCFYGGRDPRAALRGAEYPNVRSSAYGFRVVLAVPIVP